MTLADGSFIYTCAYRFEDAPRSADVSQQSEQVLRRYQISPHIYIIQTQVGDRIETQKILTLYE